MKSVISLSLSSLQLVGCISPAKAEVSDLITQKSTRENTQESSKDVTNWISREIPRTQLYLRKNISPSKPKAPNGFVVAAPWNLPGIQNYEYHWVRDAALVMNTIVTSYENADLTSTRRYYLELIKDYANFSRLNQTAPEPDVAEKVGLGEVKFNPDGSRYTQWMRPQNDGPALRAITFIRFAHCLIEGADKSLAAHLYDGNRKGKDGFHAAGLIKADLDYIAEHWRDLSYDPWEEVKGRHFYSSLVQRKALLHGADLARLLKDKRANARYLFAASQVEAEAAKFWIPAGGMTPSGTVSDGLIWDTFDRVAGLDYKTSGLDIAAVMAALHGHNEIDRSGDRFFSASDPRVLKTAMKLSLAFRNTFPIAREVPAGQGIPIGRYPEDKYNGFDTNHVGNPWYLATSAFAELYYRCAEEWMVDAKIMVTAIDHTFLSSLTNADLQEGEVISAADSRFPELVRAVHGLGDSYFWQVANHSGRDGHLGEEFSRDNGTPTGAIDLSWSYAGVLTAAQHRH